MAIREPKKLEILPLAVAIAGILVTAAIGAWQVFDARADAEMLRQSLQSNELELDQARAENDALTSISLPGFLQKYNAHVDLLKRASEAYEKAKAAKGATVSGSAASEALKRAENDLYAASDGFTDFIKLWRDVAEVFNKMLDGNATQLENSRRENNAEDVSSAAHRIVTSAPDLAEPLRLALDRLKPISKGKK
jgi:type II secretory pathway pseudopilin PulG